MLERNAGRELVVNGHEDIVSSSVPFRRNVNVAGLILVKSELRTDRELMMQDVVLVP